MTGPEEDGALLENTGQQIIVYKCRITVYLDPCPSSTLLIPQNCSYEAVFYTGYDNTGHKPPPAMA